MSEPTVKVMGVYRLNVTDELFRQQHSILYPDGVQGVNRVVSERQVRQQLGSVVLVEVLVHNRDGSFDVGHFTQPRTGVPRANWQAAWAEAYLSLDGNALAVERWSPPPVSGDLRVAFFMHGWDSTLPLQSSYGDIVCPEPRSMTDRLAQLVPFEPVD